MLFADGSFRFSTNNISPEVWSALGTRAGGEPVHRSYDWAAVTG